MHMRPCSMNRSIAVAALAALLLACLTNSDSEAAAPPRAKPYAESICSTNPDVFFCEDFEGADINSIPSNCNSTWGNPAIAQKDICWANGGSYQINTIPIPGLSGQNKVWRVSKSTGFVDIVTGRNTGTGNGTIAGSLNPTILGTGAREWYTRIQVYFSSGHVWPADYDFKMFFALPRVFVDPPSAEFEAGMYFHQDFWCNPPNNNFNDVPVIRYSNAFQQFPYQNEYCPPLNPGTSPNGVNAPRLVRGRWYTLEYHYKLATNNTGLLEFWVDGILAYRTNRATCVTPCADMGYIMIMGWMNPADQQGGYYEIDNVVMSRKYIGPAAGADSTPPAPPKNLQLK